MHLPRARRAPPDRPRRRDRRGRQPGPRCRRRRDLRAGRPGRRRERPGRSPRPEHRPSSEGAPAGVAYATRQYQLLPGATPGPTNGGPGLIKEHDGFMQLVFTHDRGTFSLLLVRADDDAELAELRHEHVFEAAVAALPESSAWTDPARATADRPGPCRFGAGELLPGTAHRARVPGHRRRVLHHQPRRLARPQPRHDGGRRAGRHRGHAGASSSGRPRSTTGAPPTSVRGSRSTSSPTPGCATPGRPADGPGRSDPVEPRGCSGGHGRIPSGCGSSGPFLGMAADAGEHRPAARAGPRACCAPAGGRPQPAEGITRDELVAALQGAVRSPA